ncbi:hypothetical protein EC957_006969 [Mortierella hygrophila]|uniref:Uncharacterized protein n=1 Tax=Mortierella hygrophila TaxID=979708 RepID=A0A9P6FDB2_9FUNG|nr:hypothetical protein EC957_006969 [Mortierella hygrophila]
MEPEGKRNKHLRNMAAGVEEAAKDVETKVDQDQLDAWIAIARGLSDDWPLVREAFQEQLHVAFEKAEPLRTLISKGEFQDHIMTRAQETGKLASERLALATGILALVGISQRNNELGPSPQSWNDKRVDALLTMAMKGYASNQESPQATRFIELLGKSFSDTQMVRSLGSMTTTPFAQSTQITPFVQFATTILRSFTLNDTTNVDLASTEATTPQAGDWGLALWVCDKLRIPRVFASRSHLEDSPDNVRMAALFAESAHLLLECLGQILRIQSVDNTYTLHRVIMACAAFTNPKDVWNLRYPSLSHATMAQAEQNLTMIIKHTYWSVPSGPKDDDTSHDHRQDRNSSNAIMIPGSFSDHVIQILEKEIRPCFANVQAHKVAQRAQATIEMHQEKLRLQDHQQQQKAIAMAERASSGSSGSSKDDGTITTIAGEETGKDIARQQQHQMEQQGKSTRFKIAPVGDTPNDDENEFWTRMDNRSEEDNDPTLPKRWDVDFLEAVPIAEWCAQQPIQDRGRILEVFMVLVGPILALTETISFRYRVRGLNLLSRFLLRYHNTDNNSNNTIDQQGASRPRPAAESRIWIKIFERTGLDQVLERTLTPLLAPIQAMFSPAPGAEDSGDSEYSLEVLNAAFGAYLTLILVNTEPGDKPTSTTDDSHHIQLGQQSSGTALTVENLFIHGLLGSFKRASPSKEYRTVILEWVARLVRPVVPLDFLLQASSDPSLQNRFQGIFGMGSLTIKYLPTLIPYLCRVLEYPFPSSPPDVRLESLTLAWRASEALYQIMDVSRARIPRHRGQLLATICKCWANSRIFSLDSTSFSSSSSSSSSSKDEPIKSQLEQEQMRLDESLVRSMRLCIEICQPKIADDSLPSGLEKDLMILRELDPAVFSPLFASS